jgi:hypothetical protein
MTGVPDKNREETDMEPTSKTITARQTYRLFVFVFLGVSMLSLPSFLAGETGVYGGIGILLAGALGLLYLLLLFRCRKALKTDLITFLCERGSSLPKRIARWIVRLILALSSAASAGFAAALLTGMVRQSLIREESYALILALILLTAAYAAAGALHSRVRVYEMLFWFVLAPLVLMLAFSAKEIDAVYYVPQKTVSAVSLAKSAYVVFACFTSMSAVLFVPEAGLQKEKKRGVRRAFLTAVVILAAAYYLLIGTFGEAALSVLDYPVITLMSMIQFKGGFLKRLDAIMLAVWFFPLFALLHLQADLGSRLLCGSTAAGRRIRSMGIVMILTFAAAMFIGCRENAWDMSARYLLYVQTPLYIMLPVLLLAAADFAGTKERGMRSAKRS